MTLKSFAVYETPYEPLSGRLNAPDTFAHVTLKDRLPVILGKTIDSFHRHLHSSGTADREWPESSKQILRDLEQLKYELQHNKPFKHLPNKELWNLCIDEFAGRGVDRWFEAPWLFSECYIYQRVAQCFHAHSDWLVHDWFAGEKLTSTLGSFDLCLKAAHVLDGVLAVEPVSQADLRLEFEQFCLASLWGNQMDLSIHAGKTAEEIASIVHSDHGEATKKYLLVNEILQGFDACFSDTAAGDAGTVHIVLDNSGAELFMDLCLADWLVSQNVASSVVLHCKDIPWFVSDVTMRDFDVLIETMRKHDGCDGTLAKVLDRWSTHFETGKWQKSTHDFFTSFYPYRYLSKVAPSLAKQIESAKLCIFKGDLNYRKLIQDCSWPFPFTTPFVEAIGPELNSLANVLALRTAKADVAAGLLEGTAERLEATEGSYHTSWLVTGKFALAQFAQKNQNK